MRIGIICYPSIGGSGLIATELGLNLAQQGHQVHFISYSVPFKLSTVNQNVFFHSVDPINYPLFNQSLYTFSLTAKIIDVVSEYKLQIIHAHYSIPHSLCAHLAREVCGINFKIITTLHGTDVTIVGQNKPLFSLNKYAIEKSDLVTTVSEFQKDHTNKYFAITKKIRVIHNFIDSRIFIPRSESASSCFAASGEKIIMHVSNFRTPKNPIGVIKTFNLVQQQIPAKLVLVGDGPGIGEIKSLCKEFEICDRVLFLGKRDNVETVIPMADCLLQPSYLESFGMVLLEGMSCEIPTVSSNVGGIPELVVHGETGFTSPPDDHEQLAKHILAICKSDELARSLGKKGRKRAKEKFGHMQMVSRYLTCYNDMLGSAGK